jgi:hypothetical protein
VKEGVHYFYWDWDGYKPRDYEPVYLYDGPHGRVAFSRYHWNLLTIWTEPVDEEGKPSVEFTSRVHTPIVKSRTADCRYVEIDPGITLAERIELVNLYAPMFKRVLLGAKFEKKLGGYGPMISDDDIPQEFVFELSSMRAGMVIGPLPRPDDLPIGLRKKMWA